MDIQIEAKIKPNPKHKPIAHYVEKYGRGEYDSLEDLITEYVSENIVSPLDFVQEVLISNDQYLKYVTIINNNLNALLVTVIEGMDTDGFDGQLLYEKYYNSFIKNINATIKRESLLTRGDAIVRFSLTEIPVTEKEFLFIYLMDAHYNDVRKIYLDQNEKKAEESK